jgi:hypothetical protein
VWPPELVEWYDAYTRGQTTPSDPTEALVARNDNPAPPSPSSSAQTSILFQNDHSIAVRLYWIDFDGKKKLYATLQPGKSISQSTYAGHLWLITDLSDKRIALVAAGKKPARFTIKAP